MRKVPIPRVTIAGGFAKMTKLAQGLLDLHSRAGSVDLPWLAGLARDHGATDELAQAIAAAHSANHALSLCAAAKFDVARWVAVRAQATAAAVVRTAPIAVDVLVVDREGRVLAVA
jgi:cobalt-precorrin-5B (C1)-methyltransferase